MVKSGALNFPSVNFPSRFRTIVVPTIVPTTRREKKCGIKIIIKGKNEMEREIIKHVQKASRNDAVEVSANRNKW